MISFMAAAIAAASAAASAHCKNQNEPKPNDFPSSLREEPKKKDDYLFWVLVFIECLIPASLVGLAGYTILKLALVMHGIK